MIIRLKLFMMGLVFFAAAPLLAAKSAKGLVPVRTDKPFAATGLLLKNGSTYSLKTGVLIYTLRGGPTFIYNKHLMTQTNKKKQVTLTLRPSFIASTQAVPLSKEMR